MAYRARIHKGAMFPERVVRLNAAQVSCSCTRPISPELYGALRTVKCNAANLCTRALVEGLIGLRRD